MKSQSTQEVPSTITFTIANEKNTQTPAYNIYVARMGAKNMCNTLLRFYIKLYTKYKDFYKI